MSSQSKPAVRLLCNSLSPGESRPSLSKSVLNMKFMKSREPVPPTSSVPSSSTNTQQNNHNHNLDISSNHLPMTAGSTGSSSSDGINHSAKNGDSMDQEIEGTQSIVFIQETTDPLSLLPGRRSFQNCNAAVERNYSARMDELNFDITATRGRKSGAAGINSVSDEEMLERYQHLVGLPRGPNQSRKPSQGSGKSGGHSNQSTSRGHHPNPNPNNQRNDSKSSKSSDHSGRNDIDMAKKKLAGKDDRYPMKKIHFVKKKMEGAITDKPKIKFRNYKPYDQSLLKGAEASSTPAESANKDTKNVSIEVSKDDQTKAVTPVSALDKALAPPPADLIQQELQEVAQKIGSNELNIVPKKVNWDLKRHAEFKVEKLRKRTQRAIVEILREKLAENGDGEEAETDDEIDA